MMPSNDFPRGNLIYCHGEEMEKKDLREKERERESENEGKGEEGESTSAFHKRLLSHESELEKGGGGCIRRRTVLITPWVPRFLAPSSPVFEGGGDIKCLCTLGGLQAEALGEIKQLKGMI